MKALNERRKLLIESFDSECFCYKKFQLSSPSRIEYAVYFITKKPKSMKWAVFLFDVISQYLGSQHESCIMNMEFMYDRLRGDGHNRTAFTTSNTKDKRVASILELQAEEIPFFNDTLQSDGTYLERFKKFDFNREEIQLSPLQLFRNMFEALTNDGCYDEYD